MTHDDRTPDAPETPAPTPPGGASALAATPASPATRVPSGRARWAVPAVVAVGVTAAFAGPTLVAAAGDGGPPDITAEQLLAAVAAAEPTPVTGTVVYTARLGLPELPIEQMGGADPLALLGGSSTMRVWTDGTERSRVALLGSTSEYSVVRDGAEAWTYSSADDEVVHYALDAEDQARYDALADQVAAGETPVAGDLPTPEEAARAVLAKADETSIVTLDAHTTVAGRDAYQLVVTPRGDGTLVERVVVAVDAETSMPLRVQAWSTQDPQTPALEVGFTDVAFTSPDDAVLAFSAPAGASTREVVVPLPSDAELMAAHADADVSADGSPVPPEGVTVTGTGWERVVEVSGLDVASLVAGDPAALATVPGSERTIGSESGQDLIAEFAPTDGSGAPGSFDLDTSALYEQLTTEVDGGRALSSALLSILVTDDGRVLVGAVPLETLRAMA